MNVREDKMTYHFGLKISFLRSCIISNNWEGQTRKFFARRSEVGGPSKKVTYFIISDLFQDKV